MEGISEHRLNLFDYGDGASNRPVQIDGRQFVLSETNDSGKAKLSVSLNGDSILFSHLDRDGGNARFIKNKKVADHLIAEYRDGAWRVHIIEFKKSIGGDTWSNMKLQFLGGLIRAYEFCGILGIDFDADNVYVYSAYYRDRFKEKDSLIDARINIRNRSVGVAGDWIDEKDSVELANGFFVRHRRIKMQMGKDDCMYGSISL